MDETKLPLWVMLGAFLVGAPSYFFGWNYYWIVIFILCVINLVVIWNEGLERWVKEGPPNYK